MLDIGEVDALRRALEQDLAAVLDEGHGREQDYERDGHADGGIGVEPSGRGREPDDDRHDDDAHVVEGVSDDVEQGAEHAKVPSGGLDGVSCVAMLAVQIDGRDRGILGSAARLALRVRMVMLVTVVVVLMEEASRDQVQAEAHASNDENQLRVLDILHRDEALDRLEEDADAEGEQEGAIEEGAERPGALPTEREILGVLAILRDLPLELVVVLALEEELLTMMVTKVTMRPTRSFS